MAKPVLVSCPPILAVRRITLSIRNVVSAAAPILARIGCTLASHGVGNKNYRTKFEQAPVSRIALTIVTASSALDTVVINL